MNNRTAFNHILGLAMNIKNTVCFFGRLIRLKISTLSAEKFADKISILKDKIKENKKAVENFKLLGIDRIFGEINDDDLENDLKNVPTIRNIEFIYQDKNSQIIQNYKISVKQKFYPISMSVFEDTLFLCIYRSNQYLKILKIDLKSRLYYEISRYVTVEENTCNFSNFGYGSRYTIVRSGSDAKLFLLKSPFRKLCEKNTVPEKSFELLVVDKEFKMLACIPVDVIKSDDGYVMPAFFDFVIHNGLVYALDIKSMCIKIFNEYLVLLKVISIPEDLNKIEDVHLAVSKKFILIGAGKSIYFIKNSTHLFEFKKIELAEFLHNITCYDDEHIIVRFIDGCYSFKLEENLSDIKYNHLTSLDPLKHLSLSAFMIKDNFVYGVCMGLLQFYKLNFTLNTINEAI